MLSCFYYELTNQAISFIDLQIPFSLTFVYSSAWVLKVQSPSLGQLRRRRRQYIAVYSIKCIFLLKFIYFKSVLIYYIWRAWWLIKYKNKSKKYSKQINLLFYDSKIKHLTYIWNSIGKNKYKKKTKTI